MTITVFRTISYEEVATFEMDGADHAAAVQFARHVIAGPDCPEWEREPGGPHVEDVIRVVDDLGHTHEEGADVLICGDCRGRTA